MIQKNVLLVLFEKIQREEKRIMNNFIAQDSQPQRKSIEFLTSLA
jgi:hypothetical protein